MNTICVLSKLELDERHGECDNYPAIEICGRTIGCIQAVFIATFSEILKNRMNRSYLFICLSSDKPEPFFPVATTSPGVDFAFSNTTAC